MCTKFAELFSALAAPFARAEIKTRPQGGRQLSYVTARTIMNRLDAVVGPENWWDDYTPGEKSVLCRLTIRLPDGQVLTKCDAGGYAGMADAGDDDKSGYSDAFKRAAVKFGPGRYLYQDGLANLVQAQVEAAIASGQGVAAASGPAVGSAPFTPPVPPLARGGDVSPSPAAPDATHAPAKLTKAGAPKTGRQLYRFAATCRIDRDLLRWMLATFTQFDTKISNWSQSQVEYALPEIKSHLEAVRAKKGHAA